MSNLTTSENLSKKDVDPITLTDAAVSKVAELIAGEMQRLGSVEQEVHAADGVDRRRRTDPQIAAQQRRGTLTREPGDQCCAQPRVLRIETLDTELIGQRDDLLDVGPQRARDVEVVDARQSRTIIHHSSPRASSPQHRTERERQAPPPRSARTAAPGDGAIAGARKSGTWQAPVHALQRDEAGRAA